MKYKVPTLPGLGDIETKSVLKKISKAHQALAELKGVVHIIPNQTILIDTLSLQEAKDSSAIENIITTHDDLYQSDSSAKSFVSIAAKEVHSYARALRESYEKVKQRHLLTTSDILQIQSTIVENSAGFRKTPGTSLRNDVTGEEVYVPPQHPNEIISLMSNLEKFINDDDLCDWDPLIKMSVIHHQFESIHPFYDGNGRTGRIINILYLVKQGLLDMPVLYLSRYINQNKIEYYKLLQDVRADSRWESWLMFMLDGIEQTSIQTKQLIRDIKGLMQSHKHLIREKHPKMYSQDLINNLFRHPYTKIEFLVNELQVHRNTAAKYLNELINLGILTRHKIGKDNLYLNDALFQLLLNAGRNHQNHIQ
ncbi:TPA: Fic family protein [Legionella pneumophila]|nr:Fic family protein [Legionella pneumophila]HAT7919980.1 Fic family protein [Legionella pneumophila]HAT7924333.1 Fic family protein [Legionella pneumophila]HAT7934212.1 Fic family protein [Legionella pneumophila]HAT8808793.1 Fic family protein [Legionella pneumophila]